MIVHYFMTSRPRRIYGGSDTLVLLTFLGSGPITGQNPVEWGEIPLIRLSVCPSVLPRPAGKVSAPTSKASGPTG